MVSGLILAAGKSVRMGQPKLLLRIGTKSILAHSLEAALRSRLGEVILVLGHEAERLRREAEWGRMRIVENPHYEEGQASSLRAGLAQVSPQAEAVLILLGDQPFVGSSVIDAVIARYEQTHAPAVVPLYQGKRGHPVLFDRSLFPELMAVEGDQGGREVLKRHMEEQVTVKIDSPAPRDVDTWEDYVDLQGGQR